MIMNNSKTQIRKNCKSYIDIHVYINMYINVYSI